MLTPNTGKSLPEDPAHLDLCELSRRYRPEPGYWDGYIFRPAQQAGADTESADDEDDDEPPVVPLCRNFTGLVVGGSVAFLLLAGLVALGRLAWIGLTWLMPIVTGAHHA